MAMFGWIIVLLLSIWAWVATIFLAYFSWGFGGRLTVANYLLLLLAIALSVLGFYFCPFTIAMK